MPPLRSMPPLLPACLAHADTPAAEMLFGSMQHTTHDSEENSWQVTFDRTWEQCTAILFHCTKFACADIIFLSTLPNLGVNNA